MNVKLQNKLIEVAMGLYAPDIKINQHFAFIVRKNKIITIAKNKQKTNPINIKNPKIGRNGTSLIKDKGSCAEMLATKKFIKLTDIEFSKCDLYVIRVDNNKKINYSKPCSSCRNLIKVFANYKNVYFSNRNGEIEKM